MARAPEDALPRFPHGLVSEKLKSRCPSQCLEASGGLRVSAVLRTRPSAVSILGGSIEGHSSKVRIRHRGGCDIDRAIVTKLRNDGAQMVACGGSGRPQDLEQSTSGNWFMDVQHFNFHDHRRAAAPVSGWSIMHVGKS
ncbi:hypothetical protein [Mesorhizobium amorphae]|uniref:hypothetical protein n=1 Tax=Mesorhizobium amorphae TaxID=71433 RepID=UPI001111F89E|nr:hypothetical protein [Mesorhizobium amorphae]